MAEQTMTSRLCERFIRHIRTGEWQADRRIPTEKELMRWHNASRNTIRTALQQLEKQGWLEATQGSGRRVTTEIQRTAGTIGILTRGGELGAGQGDRFQRAVHAAARELKHELVTFTIDLRHSKLVAEGKPIDLSAVAGAIVYAREYELDDIRRLARRMPVVAVMTHDAASVGVSSFFVDYGFHAATAVRELAKHGHDRIGLIREREFSKQHQWAEIRRGFDLGHQVSRLPARADLLFQWSGENETTSSLFERVMQADEPPSALLSYRDQPLLDLIRTGRRRGVNICKRMSLVCLADLSGRRGLASQIAHFAAPIEQLAGDAVRHLHAAMAGEASEEVFNSYYGQFKPRKTVRGCVTVDR